MSKEFSDHLIPVPEEYLAPPWGLSSIPEALDAWNKGDDNPIVSISACGNGDYLTAGTTQYIGWWLEDTDTLHAWLHHRSLNLGDKKEMFTSVSEAMANKVGSDEAVRPLITVTLSLPTEYRILPYIAITSLGHQINNPVRRAIAADLGISSKVVKAAKFNPPEIDTPVILGQQPGVIGPFVSKPTAERMHAWYYLRADSTETTPVEIALSQRDSLIVQRKCFEKLLAEFNKDFLRGFAQPQYIEVTA